MRRSIYSTYEAKARFSEILRKVRRGESVCVTYRGREVAEIRPIERTDSVEERLARLEARGIIGAPGESGERLRPVAERPGALERFLASRDEPGTR